MEKAKVRSSTGVTYLIPKSKLPKFKFLNREICRTKAFTNWVTEDYFLSLLEDFSIFNKYEFRRGPEMARVSKLWESINLS